MSGTSHNSFHDRASATNAFGRLLDVMYELREKCPWDHKQTLESLRPNTIEETYELCDALTKKNYDEIKKELGDVLMHIIFYSIISEEDGSPRNSGKSRQIKVTGKHSPARTVSKVLDGSRSAIGCTVNFALVLH